MFFRRREMMETQINKKKGENRKKEKEKIRSEVIKRLANDDITAVVTSSYNGLINEVPMKYLVEFVSYVLKNDLDSPQEQVTLADKIVNFPNFPDKTMKKQLKEMYVRYDQNLKRQSYQVKYEVHD